jgi:predicted enzyme related to lactoylglutathione lyase
MKITEIAFSAYSVTDLKRARKFYEDVLGLTPSRTSGDDAKGFVEYDIGAGTLAIGNGTDEFHPSRDGGVVVLEVEDFDHAVEELRENSCPTLFDPVDTGACRMVGISDPDGNSLLIHQRKKT